MPSEPVETRLEAFADRDEAFGQAVLDYYRDDCATLPPHHLLVTLRRVDDVALYFDSGPREWVITTSLDDDGAARYRYHDFTTGGGGAEPRKAIELEDLLQEELPEIVDVQETPLANAAHEVVEA